MDLLRNNDRQDFRSADPLTLMLASNDARHHTFNPSSSSGVAAGCSNCKRNDWYSCLSPLVPDNRVKYTEFVAQTLNHIF